MINKIKIILVVVISFTLVGCDLKDKQSDDKYNDSIVADKTFPTYKYPDDFFNRSLSKDEAGNIYFNAGMYFYKLDQQNNLHQVFNRTIDDKYQVRDAKYINGKFYLLVLKINQKITNGPLGIAILDINGSNFQYLSDLTYNGTTLHGLIYNFRIYDDNIYLLDEATSSASVYRYSLKSNQIEEMQSLDINKERTKFYKSHFPDSPFEELQHINDNKIYYMNYYDDDKVSFVKYDPITSVSNEYDISEYYVSPAKSNILFHLDLVDGNWFLISGKGVFKFDADFENVQELLSGDVYSERKTVTTENGMIVYK